MSFLTEGPQINFQPAGINAGGIKSTFGGGSYQTSASPERTGLVGQISETFGKAAGATGDMLAKVAPGFSSLRSAVLGRIQDAKDSAIGNLRDNLSRRRVLGSSFGQDAISRASAEFGRQSAEAEAQTFLQELDMTNKLTQQAFEQRRMQFQTGLDELNLEAGIASKLAGTATEQLGANARMQAQLDAQAQAGAGKMLGMAASIGLAPFTGGASLLAMPGLAGGMFGGSGGGGSVR